MEPQNTGFLLRMKRLHYMFHPGTSLGVQGVVRLYAAQTLSVWVFSGHTGPVTASTLLSDSNLPGSNGGGPHSSFHRTAMFQCDLSGPTPVGPESLTV